jgi:hypothetical protein
LLTASRELDIDFILDFLSGGEQKEAEEVHGLSKIGASSGQFVDQILHAQDVEFAQCIFNTFIVELHGGAVFVAEASSFLDQVGDFFFINESEKIKIKIRNKITPK